MVLHFLNCSYVECSLALSIESGDKMKKLNQFLSCAVFASASLAVGGVAIAAAPNLTATTVLTKLENPWDMAFLPDGAMFFTEKCHGLSVRLPSGTVNKLVGMKDAQGYAD